jgi:cytoskeletal protein CcmA (bactofilin family)
MWKLRKEDEKAFVPQPTPPVAAPVREATQAEAPKEGSHSELPGPPAVEMARIGKLVSVKGELSGRENLFVDGEVDGSIDLSGNLLTIGPNGRIRANVQAHTVVVFGRVEGNVRGSERVELRKSAVVSGDILTQRVVIEEGAFLKGVVDIRKPEPKPEARREMAAAAPSSKPVSDVGSQTPLARREFAAASSSSPSAKNVGSQIPFPEQ